MAPGNPVSGVRTESRRPEYQALKSRVHKELLNRLNLERLTQIRREDAEPEIRSLIGNLLDAESEKTPLALYERESLVLDVLSEIYGLGPLEVLLADHSISDIRGRVQGRQPPAADHRADCQLRRPEDR
jgi:pilus assembly protein CpaF